MKHNSIIDSVLKELNLSDTHSPGDGAWRAFLNLLKEDEAKLLIKNQELQLLNELGFNEVQKVWELIQEREVLIKTILGSSQDIILTLNNEARIIEFNHVAESTFGITKKEVSGLPIFSVITKGSLKYDLENYFLKKTEGSDAFFGKVYEGTISNANEEEIPVSIYINKINIEKMPVYPLYIRDLTLQKASEKTIEESRAKLILASKMSSLGEMAGGIAHEINTPLSTIQMKAELLLERLSEGGGNEKVINDSLNSIIITVKKIAKIIRGLRSFSRDGTKDPMSVCAVSQIVNDTFDLCRQKFFDHDVDLKFNFNEDLNILCRPGEISQVLLNLIQNAFDAVENLDQKWIRVDLLEDKKSVLIKVIDSGSGIVKDVQDKLMQPFFTTKAIGKGTGLGLSISRGLIMAHGGTIELETDAVNTTFCLKLPKIKTL